MLHGLFCKTKENQKQQQKKKHYIFCDHSKVHSEGGLSEYYAPLTTAVGVETKCQECLS